MRACRALLVDRVGRVRREALTMKDLDNVCHLSMTHVASHCLIITAIHVASILIQGCAVGATC
jgi:hypothetical protein